MKKKQPKKTDKSIKPTNKKPVKKPVKKQTKKSTIKDFLKPSESKNKIQSNARNVKDFTENQKKELDRIFGMILGKASKVMLQNSGMDVNYKVNGEDISDIKKLNEMDLKEKIELAIKEERYEDAQMLKNILDSKIENAESKENDVISEIEKNYDEGTLRIDIYNNIKNLNDLIFSPENENKANCYKFIEEVRGRFITKESFISFLNNAKDIVNVRIKNIEPDMVLVEVTDDDIMPHFFISAGNSKEYVKYVKKIK
jgi:hypothetical protein